MRILHVITTIAKEGGGPSRSVQGLVRALNDEGVDARLLSLKYGEICNSDIKRFSTPFDGENARQTAERVLRETQPEIVHFHKIWDWSLHVAVCATRRVRIPYVMTPRGSLEPWSLRQKALKKRVARFVYQDADLRQAAALHATADSEARQFQRLGFPNPIILSPNGVNLPITELKGSRVNSTDSAPRRALFVSRMHPKKGVLTLVKAWARVMPANWTCELVYTTRDETEAAYEAEVRALVAELHLADSFIFTGALDDHAKWDAYARADLFVLPTVSENFGIVIAEALWAGVPVITTKGAPWAELETEGCGWWTDLSVEAFAAALADATSSSPDALVRRGEAGHRLVQRRYTWPAIARALIGDYEKILAGRATYSS